MNTINFGRSDYITLPESRRNSNVFDYVLAVVPENVPIGISVINVTATDPDEGLGGEIKYDFLDEGEANGT